MIISLTKENFVHCMNEADGSTEQQQRVFHYFLLLAMIEIKDTLQNLDRDLQNVNDAIKRS